MKKLNQLTYKLEQLESQESNLSSYENISILQFIKYKNLLSKKSKIDQQIQKNITSGNEINFWYDQSTKSWIENPKINCRKYYRLEKKAEYKKDLKLYRLGLLDRRPLTPCQQKLVNMFEPAFKKVSSFYKNIKTSFKNIDFSKFNLIKKFHDQYNYFTSYILPQKVNKLAVSTATVGIKGYRKLQSDCRFIRNSITSKDSFKYIKNVIKEANLKVYNDEKEKSFRDSLKVNPNHFNNILVNSQSPITLSQSKTNIEKDLYEYEL